jgi:tripartite-type tricarboxylate transporter receptor subunit TctC
MLQVKRCVGRIAAFIAACGGLLSFAPVAQAQDGYPNQPVRLIVPFPPGGQTDNVARQLNAKITPFLGQQLIIDNRGGAAGTIGGAEAARAKPDGYTLLIATSSTHAINPSVMPNVPYNALTDFAPITVIGTGPIAISVHPIVPAKTLRQLIAEAKARPGYYSYGSSGVASINNLAGELFKMRAGNLEILHVPYKGAGPSMQDLIGGQIEMVCSTLSAALPHHNQGRVRTLAVMKEERSVGAPDIPTTREAGLADAIAYTYNIILAPARTPRGIVDHVSAAIGKVMADPGSRDTLVKLGVDPIEDSGPEKAAAMLEAELGKWRPIIQALGLGADAPTRSASPRR